MLDLSKRSEIECTAQESIKEITFLAYTAGFFDADGTVGIYFQKKARARRGGQFQLHTAITQKLWMSNFEEWHRRWGGLLWFDTIRRKVWRWELYRRGAAAFLRDIIPYLNIKRDQAVLAVKFQKAMKHRPELSDDQFEWQREIASAVRNLKQTSRPAPTELLEHVRELEERFEVMGRQLELWLPQKKEF